MNCINWQQQQFQYYKMYKNSPIRRLQPLKTIHENEEIIQLSKQIDKLNGIVYSKNLQIKNLLEQNNTLRASHEIQITKLRAIIDSLQMKTRQYQKIRTIQLETIKFRHEKASEETQTLKNYHNHEIEFLLKQIAQVRGTLEISQQKIDLKEHEIKVLKNSYERQNKNLIDEMNVIKSGVIKLQQQKNKQIRQLSAKRQLQKSRTSGIMSSRKENTQFMDKQLRKLNQQILEKSIKIENLSRQLNKQKKQLDESTRNLNKQIQTLNAKRQEQLKQKDEYYDRLEKTMKKQMIQFKEKEFKLLSDIDEYKTQLESLSSEFRQLNERVIEKQEQIKQLKHNLEQQRIDHAKQINNLISRKRSKLGSSRSLTSSLKDSNINIGQSSNIPPITSGRKGHSGLPQVREQSPDKRDLSKQLNNSQITQNQEEENEVARAVYHYDTLIQQLKKNHQAELQLLKHKIKKVQATLQQKQKQMLDVLQRFSPLVKIHAEEKTLQQDRKQRIERHWKGDLALLQILLKRNKIQAFA